MFYAYSWFHKPSLINAAQASLLAWTASHELVVCWDDQIAVRKLEVQEQADLAVLVENAWLEADFGGYSTASNIGDLNGFCHFKLDESRQQARLTALISEPIEQSLLQSSLLGEAIKELFNEWLYIEKVYLPIFEVSQADRMALAALDLVPDGKTGWWRRFYQTVSPIETATSWLELRVIVSPDAVNLVNKLFGRYGYINHTFIDWATSLNDEGEIVRDESKRAVRTYIRFDKASTAVVNHLRKTLAILSELDTIGELETIGRSAEDWHDIQSQLYPICRVGQRFIIKPFEQDYLVQGLDIVLEIVPSKGVFGLFYAGLHPSTIVALELLEKYTAPHIHYKMLDLGTGSGILAIAGAKLGIEFVLALDAYTLAIEAARDNVGRNNLADTIKVAAGSLSIVQNEAQRGIYAFDESAQEPPAILDDYLPFDIIVANIIARGSIGLADSIRDALRSGGILISSGTSLDKEDEVRYAFQASGLLLLERQERSEWIGLVYIKP